MMSALKKNSRPFRILIVGVCRYPVYHSTPLELGDIAPEEKSFFSSEFVTAMYYSFKRAFAKLVTLRMDKIQSECVTFYLKIF